MNDTSATYDVAVVGGGPAGLGAAIALAQLGAKTALIARRAPYADNGTTALLGGSVDFLGELDVWPRCRDNAAALQAMRLVDDTGRLIRAPEVRFSAGEIGLDQFGYNIENRLLMAALEGRAAELAASLAPIPALLLQARTNLTGDARDEIVLWDPDRVWIYTQDRPAPSAKVYAPKRNPLYNDSNYRAQVSLPPGD